MREIGEMEIDIKMFEEAAGLNFHKTSSVAKNKEIITVGKLVMNCYLVSHFPQLNTTLAKQAQNDKPKTNIPGPRTIFKWAHKRP